MTLETAKQIFIQRADERIPEILKIPAIIRFLSAEPMLGPICFKQSGAWNYKQRFPSPNCEINSDIQWVILGGESGPGARACDVDWIMDGIIQCKKAGVPVFVKQLGAVPVCRRINVKPIGLADKKGGDMSEWHPGFRIREFPLGR